MSIAANMNALKFVLTHPLNQGQQASAFWGWFRWQVGSHLLATPVIAPWLDNTYLIATRGETGVTQNIYCGLQDFAEMAFVLHFIRQEDRFIDIGANSGVYSVLAAGCGRARGVAVEPIPSTFERLVRQLRINQLENIVFARNVGVAENQGTLFFKTNSDTTNQIVGPDWHGPKTLLPVTTLDEIAKESPALIKIDVEDHDTEVLLGGPKTLACQELKAVIIEISSTSIPILAGHGFAPCDYDPFQRRLRILDWRAAGNRNNIIAVRDFEAVQARLCEAQLRYFHGKQF
jgi:FkbM family methyltransferase